MEHAWGRLFCLTVQQVPEEGHGLSEKENSSKREWIKVSQYEGGNKQEELRNSRISSTVQWDRTNIKDHHWPVTALYLAEQKLQTLSDFHFFW